MAKVEVNASGIRAKLNVGVRVGFGNSNTFTDSDPQPFSVTAFGPASSGEELGAIADFHYNGGDKDEGHVSDVRLSIVRL